MYIYIYIYIYIYSKKNAAYVIVNSGGNEKFLET